MARHLRSPLELDRGMVNSGLLPKQLFDRRQDLGAAGLGRGADMDARRVQPRGQGPAMEVVELLDAGEIQEVLAQGRQVDLSRRSLEKDVRGLLSETDG